MDLAYKRCDGLDVHKKSISVRIRISKGKKLQSSLHVGPLANALSRALLQSDQLGSTRIATDASGNTARRYDHLPFGTELPADTGGRTTAMKYFAAAHGLNPKFTRRCGMGPGWITLMLGVFGNSMTIYVARSAECAGEFG